MKNVLILGLMLFAVTASAQEKLSEIQKKQAEYFASEAVKYFELDDSKKEAIYEAKLNLMVAQKEMNLKKKNGEIDESNIQAYRKQNLHPKTQKLMRAVEVKSWKELNEFTKKIQPEINKINS